MCTLLLVPAVGASAVPGWMQRRPHYAAPPRPCRDAAQDVVAEAVAPRPSQAAGRPETTGALKASAKPAKHQLRTPPAASQPARRVASSRPQEAGAKVARCQPSTARPGLISGAQASALPRKENVVPDRHKPVTTPTGWLPHPLRVRGMGVSGKPAASQPAALPLVADTANTAGRADSGVVVMAIAAETPCSQLASCDGNASKWTSATGPVVTPPQLPPAEKDGWKAGQAAKIRSATARLAAFEESPRLPAPAKAPAPAVHVAINPVAAAAAAAKQPAEATQARHTGSGHAESESAVRSDTESSDLSSRSDRSIAAKTRSGSGLRARTAKWREFAAAQTRGRGMLRSRSYRSGTVMRAMASRSSSASRRGAQDVQDTGETSQRTHAPDPAAADSCQSCNGSTIDTTTAGAVHDVAAKGAEGRSENLVCEPNGSAKPHQASAGSARSAHRDEAGGRADVGGGGAETVRVVNVAAAARLRVVQSVQVKPAVRVSYSPAAVAGVVAKRPARKQVSRQMSPSTTSVSPFHDQRRV